MSTDQSDQTIIAWKSDEQAGDRNSADISEEDEEIQYLAPQSEGAEEAAEADYLPETVTNNNNTGPLTSSRNVSIGSFEEAGAPPGIEDDRKTRLKKPSLCSTLSSGDQPYLSLISSEREQQGEEEVILLCFRHQPQQEGVGGSQPTDINDGSREH